MAKLKDKNSCQPVIPFKGATTKVKNRDRDERERERERVCKRKRKLESNPTMWTTVLETVAQGCNNLYS